MTVFDVRFDSYLYSCVIGLGIFQRCMMAESNDECDQFVNERNAPDARYH